MPVPASPGYPQHKLSQVNDMALCLAASEAAAEDPAVGEQLDTAPAVNGTQPETAHGHDLVQPQAEQSEAGDTERRRKQQPGASLAPARINGASLADQDEPSSPAGKSHIPSLFAHCSIPMLADGLC